MNLSETFIRRPIATSLLMAGIAMFGVMAYRALPVSDLPNVDFPTITVSASLPGADPATMASAVATPLERQFTTIAGIDSMTSVNSLGNSQITLQFDLDRKIDGAAVDVQTAIATAKKAEQQAITVAKEGEAAAAKAKWEQEVIKAKAVVEAQQALEVAQLDTKKAEQEKMAKILRAEGESEYKRKIIVADGALEQKLAAYKEVQAAWAQAFAEYKGPALVPAVVMAPREGAAAGGTGAQALIDMLSAKTARDLALDLSIPSGSAGK